MAPTAHEVRVGLARGRAGHLHQQAFAALPAIQARLQIVRVAAGAFADLVRRQDSLHLLPQVVGHERFVAPRMEHPLEPNEAPVVGVDQDLVEEALGDGARRQ